MAAASILVPPRSIPMRNFAAMVPHPQVVLFHRVNPPFAMAMKKVETGSCIECSLPGQAAAFAGIVPDRYQLLNQVCVEQRLCDCGGPAGWRARGAAAQPRSAALC